MVLFIGNTRCQSPKVHGSFHKPFPRTRSQPSSFQAGPGCRFLPPVSAAPGRLLSTSGTPPAPFCDNPHKITHSNPPLQFSSPGLCLTRARAPPAQRPQDAGRRQERRKGVGTHLPSVVVVNNYSQDESRHCPVFSLKTSTTNCYLENRSENSYISCFLKREIILSAVCITLNEQEREKKGRIFSSSSSVAGSPETRHRL